MANNMNQEQQTNILSDNHGMVFDFACERNTYSRIKVYAFQGKIQTLTCDWFDNGNCTNPSFSNRSKQCPVIRNADFFSQYNGSRG